MEQMQVAGEKSVVTPGVHGADEDHNDDDVLQGEEVRAYCGLAARCNYLGPDRPDALYAIKEGRRDMSKPTTGSRRMMPRIAKYFKKRPRLVWRFDLHPEPIEISLFTDSDWAGCKRSQKSISGGVILLGDHRVKVWSNTQSVIAKSSTKAELYSVIKGA